MEIEISGIRAISRDGERIEIILGSLGSGGSGFGATLLRFVRLGPAIRRRAILDRGRAGVKNYFCKREISAAAGRAGRTRPIRNRPRRQGRARASTSKAASGGCSANPDPRARPQPFAAMSFGERRGLLRPRRSPNDMEAKGHADVARSPRGDRLRSPGGAERSGAVAKRLDGAPAGWLRGGGGLRNAFATATPANDPGFRFLAALGLHRAPASLRAVSHAEAPHGPGSLLPALSKAAGGEGGGSVRD